MSGSDVCVPEGGAHGCGKTILPRIVPGVPRSSVSVIGRFGSRGDAGGEVGENRGEPRRTEGSTGRF